MVGAYGLDTYAYETNPRYNLPVVLGLVDVYNKRYYKGKGKGEGEEDGNDDLFDRIAIGGAVQTGGNGPLGREFAEFANEVQPGSFGVESKKDASNATSSVGGGGALLTLKKWDEETIGLLIAIYEMRAIVFSIVDGEVGGEVARRGRGGGGEEENEEVVGKVEGFLDEKLDNDIFCIFESELNGLLERRGGGGVEGTEGRKQEQQADENPTPPPQKKKLDKAANKLMQGDYF